MFIIFEQPPLQMRRQIMLPILQRFAYSLILCVPEDGHHDKVGWSQTFYQFFIIDTALRRRKHPGLEWPTRVTYLLNLALVRSDLRVGN